MSDSMEQQQYQQQEQQQPQAQAGAPAFDPGAIVDRMKRVIIDPAGFFQQMPKKGGYAEPLVFAVSMAVVTALVWALLGFIGFGAVGMFALGFFGVIIVPFAVAIGHFIGAAVLFVIWKLMGSQEDYETAYRCAAFSYAYAPVAALVAGVPYIGTLVQILWPMALLALASIHVHGRSPKLAWGVFGILGLLSAFSSLSAEFATRHITSGLEDWSQQMDQKYGKDEMTPEQAGKAVGDFLKGLQQMQQKGQ